MFKSKLQEVLMKEGIKAAELARTTKLANSTIYKAVGNVRIPNSTNLTLTNLVKNTKIYLIILKLTQLLHGGKRILMMQLMTLRI